MMAYTMRYQEELRDPKEYFADIKKVDVNEESLGLAMDADQAQGGEVRSIEVQGRVRGGAEGAGGGEGEAPAGAEG